MTTGIYQLTFADGSTYIGKSINIEERQNQHYNKMMKGTAAKAMQDAYYRHGIPRLEVLFECHQDHMDIMEETLIARMQPTHNTTRVADRLEGIYDNNYLAILSYLKDSTVDHIVSINKLTNENITLRDAVEYQINKIEELQERRSKEELLADIDNKVAEAKESRQATEDKCRELNAKVSELLEYKYSPWYKKIFN